MGLLIWCTDHFTKRIHEFKDLEKEYTGTFFIGKTNHCYDLEKEPDTDYPTEHITTEMIRNTAASFVGPQEQYPPIYSAVKLDGKPLYTYARKGHEVEIKVKQITIHEFELTRIEMPEVDFRIVCSKGTYIRALARDLGEAMGSGAYLAKLCRTRIGQYRLEDAITLKELEEDIKKS